MHLSQYLKENNLTATAFAERINRHKSTVTRILKGEMRPDPDTTDRIFEVTRGAVTASDLYGHTSSTTVESATGEAA